MILPKLTTVMLIGAVIVFIIEGIFISTFYTSSCGANSREPSYHIMDQPQKGLKGFSKGANPHDVKDEGSHDNEGEDDGGDGYVGSSVTRTPTQNDVDVDKARKKTKEKWDNAQQNFAEGGAWHQHPLVTKTYSKRLGAGSGDMISHLIDNYGQGKTCISIGCGDGGIEVALVTRRFCATLKGIDLSPVRVASSNARVPEYLKDRIEFLVEDAEKHNVQESFDVVLFTHALHHISNLEGMSAAIRDHLMNPNGGILVLEEYVGAVRWQFPPEHVAEIVSLLKDLERDHPNYIPIFRQNPLWDGETFHLPDPVSVENDDPSETVRSNEIVPVLSNYFKIAKDVPTGGIFFQWIFHNAYNALKTEEGNQIVQKMLDREMEVIRNGIVKSDYVFQVWKHQDHDEGE
jgi:2-polyprenyl-3-methyl-5-hydroxy-6-metoxy-1,4-benzoquinol methylase